MKLNSYSNASIFLSLCRMRISVFWGHGRLTDRSISKRYLKSDMATWIEKSSTSRAIHARDTGFYWSSENALHERFIASSGVGVWMKRYSLSQSDEKTLALEYEFSMMIKTLLKKITDPTTDLDQRSQTSYVDPCNGIVSHGAPIGGIQVFANHSRGNKRK